MTLNSLVSSSSCSSRLVVAVVVVVCLYHRACTGFSWDNDGDVLSVISDKSSVVFLWDANNWRLNQLDSGFRFLDVLLSLPFVDLLIYEFMCLHLFWLLFAPFYVCVLLVSKYLARTIFRRAYLVPDLVSSD